MSRKNGRKVADTWQLQDAKTRLSEVVRRARSRGPQRVTTRGGDPVIIIAEEQYRALVSPPEPSRKISDILARTGIGELELERTPDYGRDVEL